MKWFLFIILFIVGCGDFPNQMIDGNKPPIVWTSFHYDSIITVDSWTAMNGMRKIYVDGYVVNNSVYDIIMTPKLHAYVLDNDTTGMIIIGNPIYIKVDDTMRVYVETNLFIAPWYYKPRGEFEFVDKMWIVEY